MSQTLSHVLDNNHVRSTHLYVYLISSGSATKNKKKRLNIG